ncbi:MAG: SMC-Scp complex subunit ScpB [Planctomycetota bacterium]
MSSDTQDSVSACGHAVRLAAVEALLFSLDKPVPSSKLAETIASVLDPGDAGAMSAADIDDAVSQLNAVYDDTGRAFRVERVAGGLRVMTRPEHASLLAAFHWARSSAKLSKPAIETLAVIAYRQPVTRARLEAIRGVACGEVLKTLLEKRLIAITGRAEELGRPMLYATTRQFLDVFGLANIKDLPPAGSDLVTQVASGVVSSGAADGPSEQSGEPAGTAQRTEE